MAKSIKLGSDTYLDASGVDGIKGVIRSGADLDNYYGERYAGLYYISASASDVSNCPVGYSGLLVIGSGSIGFQLLWGKNSCYFRGRTGGTPTWGTWKAVTFTDTGS